MLCPEGAATAAAYTRALDAGLVGPQERVVLFNCASGLKYPMPPAEARLDVSAEVDYAALMRGGG